MNFCLGILLISSVTGTSAPVSRKRHREDDLVNSTTAPRSEQPLRAVTNLGKTATGKIIEIYNTTIVAEYYGDWLAKSIESLLEMDERQMAPNITMRMKEILIDGMLAFGELFAAPHQSAIFTLRDNPEKLIKYQSNCAELDFEIDLTVKPYIHPSVVEFAFTRRAAYFGLAPRVLMLSPPVGLCESKSGKCQFNMSTREYELCRSNPNSSLRYMIMDRVDGVSLFDYANRFSRSIVPFAKAMAIGVKLISVLEKLHVEARIGHGDIHESNIMISKDGDLTLIDFARSFALQNRKSKRIRQQLWSTHPMFSYSEIAGFIPTALDDILRAVETIARLMNPRNQYFLFLRIITAENPNAILTWKFKRNIFHIPHRIGAPWAPFEPVRNLILDSNTTFMIESRLLDVLNVTRNLAHSKTIPYNAIREAFSECLRLATP